MLPEVGGVPKIYLNSFNAFPIISAIITIIAETETKDVKPELNVKTEKDDMPSTSHHEGRYLKMSPKQEAAAEKDLCDVDTIKTEEECIMYWSQAETTQREDTGNTSVISSVKQETEEDRQSVCSNDNSDTSPKSTSNIHDLPQTLHSRSSPFSVTASCFGDISKYLSSLLPS